MVGLCGDLEDRDDLVAVDLDFGDAGLDGGLALAGCAVLEDVDEVAADGVDRVLTRRCRLGIDRRRQVDSAMFEPGGLGLKVAQAAGEGVGVEGAGLERCPVAGDRGAGGGELLVDAGEFGAVGVVPAGAVFSFAGDGVGDECGIGVEVGEGFGDGVFEGRR